MAAFIHENHVSVFPATEQLQRLSQLAGKAVRKVSEAISVAYRRARTRRELEALSVRQLEDIGLSRGDIEKFVSRF